MYISMLQVEASLFSSKFSISRKTTIPSDNTEHKVHMYIVKSQLVLAYIVYVWYIHVLYTCSCRHNTGFGVLLV